MNLRTLIGRSGITSEHFRPIDVYLVTAVVAEATWWLLTHLTHLRPTVTAMLTATAALLTFTKARTLYLRHHTPPAPKTEHAATTAGDDPA